ncbi:MAG: 4Fe-4S dicluster domain-containing protein [Candidatus Omnitrophota bacterium]
MKTLFLKADNLHRFYQRIAETFELYVPVRVQTPQKVNCDYGLHLPTDDYLLVPYSSTEKEKVVFNDYRSIEPAARAFFTYFKEEVCDYFIDQETSREEKEKPVALAGIKNCDLFSLKIQDFVFLGGNEIDSTFESRRKNALIISGDCPNFKEVCFCRAFDINPYATEGFDFNFSPLNDGYLVDVATERASSILESLQEIVTSASSGQLSGRQAKRDAVIKKMEEHLSYHKIPKKESLQEVVVAGYNSKVWQEQMLTCVECGGCIFMCDTCHCFLLTDEASGEDAKRLRVWDGCLLKNFTKVAGGANPLKMRPMRLRNRFMKKFDFFISNIGFQACCGCGRCVDVCPGHIDIRTILRRLYEEKYLPAR